MKYLFPIKKLKPDFIFLALILGTSSYLLFFQIGYKSFWEDEFYSIRDALYIDIPDGKMWDTERGFSGPFGIRISRSMYYIGLRLWMFFSTSDVWIRSFSAVFALACIYLTYEIGKKVFNKNVGLLSAILLTFSPIFIQYGREARMYSFGTFWGLLGCLFLLNEIKISKLSFIIPWLMTRYAMVLTIPTSAILFFADLSFLIKKKPGYSLRLWCLFISVFIACFPILAIAGIEERHWLKEGTAKKSIEFLDWIYRFYEYILSSKSFRFDRIIIFVFLFIFIVFSVKLVTLAFKYQNKYLLLLLWIWVPSLTFCILSLKFSAIFTIRYSLFIQPFVCIVVSWGIVDLFLARKSRFWKYPRLFILAVLTLAYINSVISGINYYYNQPVNQDWKQAVNTLEEKTNKCDSIALYYPSPAQYALDLYSDRIYFAKTYNFSSGTQYQKIIVDYLEDYKIDKNCSLWTLALDRHVSKDESKFIPQKNNFSFDFWQFPGVKLYRFSKVRNK